MKIKTNAQGIMISMELLEYEKWRKGSPEWNY